MSWATSKRSILTTPPTFPDTAMPAYIEVIDEETGEVVVEEEFEGETEVTIDQTGSYIVQIYSGNTVMTGEFEVE